MNRPEKDAHDPAPLRDLLSGAATRFGLDDALATGSLWRRWRDVVGHDVAAHAEPTSLRSGVLRIRAESPAWAHEIGYLSDEIKRRVNEALGRQVVAQVKVWTGPGVRQAAGPPPSAAATEPGRVLGPEGSSVEPLDALERAREAQRRRPPEGP